MSVLKSLRDGGLFMENSRGCDDLLVPLVPLVWPFVFVVPFMILSHSDSLLGMIDVLLNFADLWFLKEYMRPLGMVSGRYFRV